MVQLEQDGTPRTDPDGPGVPVDPVMAGSTASAARGSIPARAVTLALWGLAALVTLVLVHQRYRSAVSGPIGADFSVYLHAARQIAAGHSPYQDNPLFVYPPTVALVLAPFAHVDPVQVWRAWTLLELGAIVSAVAGLVVIERARLRAWRQPVLFIIGSVTALHFWPLTIGLSLGQADAFVLAALMLSAVAASRARPGVRGAFIGVAGLLKTWPAAVGVSLLQRGNGQRRRALVGWVVALLVAPALALCFGGGSGLLAFVKSVVAARNQHLVNDSVWGVPTLLFSRSGLAHPIVVSGSLEALLTAVLLVWVIGLLAIALRTPGDPVLCTWNVSACIVLLLPVSHLAYSLYFLPLLWLWGSRLLGGGRVGAGGIAVTGVLILWWIIQTRTWPDTGSPAGIGALHYCVVFAADLIACSASVLGARFVPRTGRSAPA